MIELLTPTVNSERNGTAPVNRFARSATPASSSAPLAPSLDDLDRDGFKPYIPVAWVLLGLGTTGAAVIHALVQWARREWGRLPNSLAYLLVDAATRPAAYDATHWVGLGVDGSGTKPEEGRIRYDQHAQQLRAALSNQFARVFEPDSQFPLSELPRKAVNVFVVTGVGGTSGGCHHPMLDLVHEVARAWAVNELRLHNLVIGPEIAIRDHTRSVALEQQAIIRDTAAVNLAKLLDDWSSDTSLTIPAIAGGTFSIPAAQRVWSLSFADQTNGHVQFSRVDDLVRMLALVLFTRVATDLGPRGCAERMKDLHIIGTTGKGSITS